MIDSEQYSRAWAVNWIQNRLKSTPLIKDMNWLKLLKKTFLVYWSLFIHKLLAPSDAIWISDWKLSILSTFTYFAWCVCALKVAMNAHHHWPNIRCTALLRVGTFSEMTVSFISGIYHHCRAFLIFFNRFFGK